MNFFLKDEPIIQSRLDIDFYKFPMGQLIFKKHPGVTGTFEFRCRTQGVSLTSIIPIEQLREQLDHVRTLMYTNSELHYLRGTNEYQERMFFEDYLQFLNDLRLPDYELRYIGDEISLRFPGLWSEDTYWETKSLSIINELYFRNVMLKKSRFEQDAVYANGMMNLDRKIKLLREFPGLTFSDFGTRRRACYKWQKYVVNAISSELPRQFKGTSNVKISMDGGHLPTGTSAHEMDMGYSGIYHGSDEEIRSSHRKFLADWKEMYGYGLSIALTDTYGSDFFFEDFSKEDAEFYKGYRQDSGAPIVLGEKAIKFCEKNEVDPLKKLVIFSDALCVEKMIEYYKHFCGRIMTTNGWGTDLTNDLGIAPLSMVTKLVESNGHGTVKLSDNLNKAMGKPEDVERFKKIFGYTNTNAETCKY